MKSASDLLLDLIAIPSVSSMSNQPVIDYVTSCLPARQWRIEPHGYLDAAGVGKTNLVALSRNANQNDAELAFVCHTDTVPYQADWDEGVRPVLRDGHIYGRGSCDVIPGLHSNGIESYGCDFSESPARADSHGGRRSRLRRS